MFCKRCGSALPSEGFICKVCGAMMDQEQINEQRKFIKENERKVKPLLMSQKYGRKNNIVYNDEKTNTGLMSAVLFIIIVFLVVLSLIIFFASLQILLYASLAL